MGCALFSAWKLRCRLRDCPTLLHAACMTYSKSRQRKLVNKWLDRAREREQAVEELEKRGLDIRATNSQIMADTFRLCASELNKL